MISFKGEYEEALRVMRVARKKFPLFLPDFVRTALAKEYKGGRMEIYYQ